MKYAKLTRRDRQTLLFALNLASEWEASLSASYTTYGITDPEARATVARCLRNIKRFQRLKAKVRPRG